MWFKRLILSLTGIIGLVMSAVVAQPVGTAFTYQGELKQAGTLADGPYDFQFELFDTGGLFLEGPLQLEDVPVSEGRFTVELDFGAGPFAQDQAWLAIAVREGASTGAFISLLPRQKVTAVPYALKAELVAMSSVGAAEVDNSQVQLRVFDSCPPDSSIRAVGAGGGVDCEPDTDTINTDAGILNQGFLSTDRYDAYDDLLASDRLDNDDNNDLLQRWQLDERFQGRSGALTVPGNAFVRDGTNCLADRNAYGISFVAGSGSGCAALAPISLPDAVLATSLSCHVYDNDSSPGAYINISFCATSLDASGSSCAVSSDSVDSPNDQILTRNLADIIGNDTEGYFLGAMFGTAVAVGSKVSLTGCIVHYQIP